MKPKLIDELTHQVITEDRASTQLPIRRRVWRPGRGEGGRACKYTPLPGDHLIWGQEGRGATRGKQRVRAAPSQVKELECQVNWIIMFPP